MRKAFPLPSDVVIELYAEEIAESLQVGNPKYINKDTPPQEVHFLIYAVAIFWKIKGGLLPGAEVKRSMNKLLTQAVYESNHQAIMVLVRSYGYGKCMINEAIRSAGILRDLKCIKAIAIMFPELVKGAINRMAKENPEFHNLYTWEDIDACDIECKTCGGVGMTPHPYADKTPKLSDEWKICPKCYGSGVIAVDPLRRVDSNRIYAALTIDLSKAQNCNAELRKVLEETKANIAKAASKHEKQIAEMEGEINSLKEELSECGEYKRYNERLNERLEIYQEKIAAMKEKLQWRKSQVKKLKWQLFEKEEGDNEV